MWLQMFKALKIREGMELEAGLDWQLLQIALFRRYI